MHGPSLHRGAALPCVQALPRPRRGQAAGWGPRQGPGRPRQRPRCSGVGSGCAPGARGLGAGAAPAQQAPAQVLWRPPGPCLPVAPLSSDGSPQRALQAALWGQLALWSTALLCGGWAGSAHAASAASGAGTALAAGAPDGSMFREGAVSGFLLIFFSELGDKTFFIAVLLALKEARATVFLGTFGALAVMTLISVGLGQLLHQLDEALPSRGSVPVDDLLAAALLVFFGLRTLQGAAQASEDAKEEREEAQQDVAGLTKQGSELLLSTFLLIFAAEWGDKSFLATIALAAASSPAGVVLGAIGGHGAATGLAVVGGSYLGQYVSERTVAYVGGSLFLVFAAVTLYDVGRQMALL